MGQFARQFNSMPLSMSHSCSPRRSVTTFRRLAVRMRLLTRSLRQRAPFSASKTSLSPRSLVRPATQRRACHLAFALWGSTSDRSDDFRRSNMSERRQALMDAVKTLSPSPNVSTFDIPAPVLQAMRQTVSNLLGTLPPQFFRITISTRADNLAQLMFSVLMTGFMFCNAYYRMELAKSLNVLSPAVADSPGALVGSLSGSLDDDCAAEVGGPAGTSGLATGSQKLKIEGEVLRWHHEDGVQSLSALDYIHQLEDEVTGLRRELNAARRAAATSARASPLHNLGANELLEYLKGLSAEQVSELTDCASPDVLESMNALVRRLIGEDGEEGTWVNDKSECTAAELAQLLYWLLAVGYHLRTIETKLTLKTSLEFESTYGPDDGADDSPAAGWVPRLPPSR